MKWDPFLERNTLFIIKDISYKSSKIRCPTSLETVGYLGKTQDSLVLRSNKTPRSPALSTAGHGAAYRLTRSDLWGEWKTLVFPLGAALGSLLRSYFALYSILLRRLYFAIHLLKL